MPGRFPLTCLVVAVSLCACQTTSSPGPAPSAQTPGATSAGTPQPPAGSSATATGDDTLITEPDQGIAPIQALITSAHRSIDMTMYELEDEPTEQLLADAAGRGVAVRVVLDHSFSGTKNEPAFGYLSTHGVAVHWASTRYAITHQKTIVIDGQEAAVMTLNLTAQYYASSRDFAVVDRDPADVAVTETVFSADFVGQPVGTPQGDDLVWSPSQSASTLPSLINSAQRSLLVENEEMASTAITDALAAAARRGVDVEVCMTDSSSWHRAFDTLTAAGVHVFTYGASAPLYIHAKVIVADPGSPGARVFVGSENFSTESLEYNRELGVLLGSAAVIGEVARTVQSDVRGGRAWG